MFIINFFNKIINSMKNKQKRLNSGNNNNDIKEIDNFMNLLQKDTKEHFNKKEILELVDKNPNLIDSLSYERLVQLNKLYEEKITELEKKLNTYKMA